MGTHDPILTLESKQMLNKIRIIGNKILHIENVGRYVLAKFET
jgi:hypothetical protein